ncbi:BON domain-containing protein [Chitinimonas lacunae]|uniref:BON domain-containing protein n=1 Tax=Chitinimonas lacunae TaxID=1963018 RepID=A0ABV8MM76_9NEIS
MKFLKQGIYYLLFALATAGAPVLADDPPRTEETPGQYLDDAVITTKVKAALIGDTNLKANEINVETYRGTVQLSGFVDDPQTVSRAADVASTVKGVKSIKNDLQVKK